ncbi:hypothetical protein AS593_07140 [Caulobacter vibrioides]|nr:hypothetical protein AS593_07140 [Caulobacter vibrioides]
MQFSRRTVSHQMAMLQVRVMEGAMLGPTVPKILDQVHRPQRRGMLRCVLRKLDRETPADR